MQSNQVYKSAIYFRRKYDVSSEFLRTRGETGQVGTIRTSTNGRRKYNVRDVEKLFDDTSPSSAGKLIIIYARVSSAKQKEDLERQRDDLVKSYPEHTQVFTDIGSGVNFKRKGLGKLLELVCEGLVQKVIVSYKDRLARVGYDCLEQVFQHHGTEIVVHNQNLQDEDGHTDDLIAIVTSFVASHHGRRASEHRKRRNGEENKIGIDKKSKA